MASLFRLFLVCATCVLATDFARAQAPDQPPPPLPPGGSGTPVLPQVIQIPQPGGPPAGQPPVLPAPGPVPTLPPPSQPVLGPPPIGLLPNVEPLVFRPKEPPGWYAGFEIGVLAPDISGHQGEVVNVGGKPRFVTLPFNGLDWTGSPMLDVGYRFAGGYGGVEAAYRSVVSQGGSDVDGLDPSGSSAFIKTRFNLNSVDLNYVGPTWPLGPLWDVNWDAGLRIGAVYYDSLAQGETLSRHVTNNFVGAGPRAGIAVRRYLEDAPGFSVFGRLETGLLIGGDSQSYSESINLPHHAFVSGSNRFTNGETAPMLGFQIGVSYSPPQDPHWFRLSFGYEFERWWNVGGAGDNSGDIQFQGIFFRGEFHF